MAARDRQPRRARRAAPAARPGHALQASGRIREADIGGRLQGEQALHVAETDAIDGALADLKPDARAALVLRHYYGYDYVEIAGLLRTIKATSGRS